MTVTDSPVDNIREDIRAIGGTVSEIMHRVAAHDLRFDQHDARFDQLDRRLDGIDGTLRQILVLVGGRS